jgi:xanthine dehydrogenase accessory factor
MSYQVFEKIAAAIAERSQLWIVTVGENSGSIPGKTGMKMSVDPDGRITGTIGGGELEKRVRERVLAERPAAAAVWDFALDGEEGALCGGTLALLVEPLLQGTPLYIFGAGHCAMALSRLASECGFLVTVFDERVEWANREKHPRAFATIVGSYADLFANVPRSREACYLIMTQGHSFDEIVLRQLAVEELGFVGMLGSEKKVETIFANLERSGIPRQSLARISAPVGIPIGSHEPMEIAVSIVADLIARRNGLRNPVRAG